jgi:O-acetylhomoserine (thiol)-lyase
LLIKRLKLIYIEIREGNKTKKKKFETINLHSGQEKVDKEVGARAVPIYQTTSFVFKDTKHAANLFSLKEEGHIYSRISNPTIETFEKRITDIESGIGAVAVSSGMAAEALAILGITKLGDEIVAGTNLYGGTYQLLNHSLPKLGRKTTFVNSSKPENFRKAINKNTKLIYVETIGNPKLDVPDFEKIAKIAHKAGIALIVDNTVGVGIVRPIEYGADIIVQSATKWIGGHGTSIGGIITDSGNFNWNNGKFPELVEPDPSYHGISYWKEYRNAAFVNKIRNHMLRDFGAALSPFNAFLFLQGLETLHLRVERHCENALAVAKFLNNHPLVQWVNYPGLPEHTSHKTAKKYLRGKFGGLVGFGIKGGLKAGKKFIESVKLLSHLANIGDAKSLVIHPASTTHQQLTKKEQEATGVTEDYIRLSIGLENIEDIKCDIDQALKNTRK